MSDGRPGLNAHRLVKLMHETVARCALDLAGATVLTEAASGAYVVTPILAALAGAARVYAVTRTTRYGSAEEITEQTLALARRVGCADRIRVVTHKTPQLVGAADVVTNSGHVRPIDAAMIDGMKPTAVVPLMYESWEFRPGDVDLDACRRRGIAVAGTNEQHPALRIFASLGISAVKLLVDAGIAAPLSRVLVLCDNAFAPWIREGLAGVGATVEVLAALSAAYGNEAPDAIVVALRPGARPVIGAAEAALIARRWPGTVVTQLWGDLDRAALAANDVPYWPTDAPAPGHMGVLPSAVGAEWIVRLQAGGLKVGAVLRQPAATRSAADREYLDDI